MFSSKLRFTLLLILLSPFLLMSGRLHSVSADIFDSNTGSQSGIFSGIVDGFDGIFDGIRGLLPGGVVIPGLIVTPTPAVAPPGPTMPPLPDQTEKVKLQLEWDSQSIGGESVAASGDDPLSAEHIAALRCPVCGEVGSSDVDTCDGEGITSGSCGAQTECSLGEVRHVLYGWCGHEPEVTDGSLVPSNAQVAYEGPNAYTLPNAVSNKYIRRDGYYFQCVRACDEDGGIDNPGEFEGTCVTHNYTEFQTMVYPSNGISMYITAQNTSAVVVEDMLVKVSDQYANFPLPQNLDYPAQGIYQLIHGSNLSTVTNKYVMNGIQMQFLGGEVVFGPFTLQPGERISLPLQLPSSEWSLIPGSASGGPGGRVGAGPATQDPEEWCACVADSLVGYMNAVISGTSGINLLSPAFNLSSPTFDCLFEAMDDAGGNFNSLFGLAGNAYNLSPDISIEQYADLLRDAADGGRIFLTETGMKERDDAGTPRDQAFQHYLEEAQKLNADPNAVWFMFNGFQNNGQSSFQYNDLSDDEILQLCGGDCSNVGINTAVAFGNSGQAAIDRAQRLGIGYVLEIAESSTDIARIQAWVNAGIKPVIRIGTGSGSGGFDNASDYIAFLNQLKSVVGADNFIAIAGPNEPDLESWAAPQCGIFGSTGANDPGNAAPGRTGMGGIIPRDFNFVCDPNDPLESARCAGGDPNHIIQPGSANFDLYRDVTGAGSCGYNASSNNSIVGPIEVSAEYGGQVGARTSRSVLLGSIPIGGRFVDDQSRPYGWPTTGEVEQEWGFTGQAEAEGTVRHTPNANYGEFRYCSVSAAPPRQGPGTPRPTPDPASLAECNAPVDTNPNDNTCPFSTETNECALARAAAKYGVDLAILQAVYEIEYLPFIVNNATEHTCVKNSVTALGPGQMIDSTYDLMTTNLEYMSDDVGVCSSPDDKLSRCDPVDAFELMARLLLSNVGRLDYSTMQPIGTLTVAEPDVVYNATCRYYGSFKKDCATCRYGYNMPNGYRTSINPTCREWSGSTGVCPVRGAGFSDMNYCDIVCNKLGTCPPYGEQKAR